MTTIASRELRYLLTLHIHRAGRAHTVAELVETLDASGVQVSGRVSKVVSDALRSEVRRRRLIRVGRAAYAPGVLPRSTRRFLRDHLQSALASRTQAEPSGLDSDSV